MRVAINGFGRIGRMIFRAVLEQKFDDIEIVAVNDLQDIDTSLHLLKYDSVHGILSGDVRKVSNQKFEINGREVGYFSERNIENLPWKNLSIDLVMECTGVFKTREKYSLHLKAGAKKVLLSFPCSDADKTIIFGVNENLINPQKDMFISNGSCTTNCLAPVVKIISSEYGIDSGFVSTVHSYTGDQRLIDSTHKDLRRARAAAVNIIPTTTGAAKAIGQIFPELNGKLAGVAFRVPTPNVSLIDCNFYLKTKTSIEDVNGVIRKWSEQKLSGVLGYTNKELVSSDFCHSSYSSVVDLSLTNVINGTFLHLISWYDNEWGFSCRMLDTARLMF